MSEDLSEGEKGDTVGDLSAHGEHNKARLPRISSVDAMETWVSQQKGKKLYIVLIRQELNLSNLVIFWVLNRDSGLMSLCAYLNCSLILSVN